MKKLLFLTAAMLQTAILMAQSPEKQKITGQPIKITATNNQGMASRDGVVRPNRHFFIIEPVTNIQQMHDLVDSSLPRNMAHRQDKFDK